MIKRYLWLAMLIATPSSALAQQSLQSLRPGQLVRINGSTKVSYVALRGDSLMSCRLPSTSTSSMPL